MSNDQPAQISIIDLVKSNREALITAFAIVLANARGSMQMGKRENAMRSSAIASGIGDLLIEATGCTRDAVIQECTERIDLWISMSGAEVRA